MSKNIPKTELLYNKSVPIDKLSVSGGISLIIKEQKNASKEVSKASKSIEESIKAIHTLIN